MSRVEEIRERLSKATPGDWETRWTCDLNDDDHCGLYSTVEGRLRYIGTVTDADDADEDLIANAQADIRYLLDELEKVQAERDEYRSLITPLADALQAIELAAGDDATRKPAHDSFEAIKAEAEKQRVDCNRLLHILQQAENEIRSESPCYGNMCSECDKAMHGKCSAKRVLDSMAAWHQEHPKSNQATPAALNSRSHKDMAGAGTL